MTTAEQYFTPENKTSNKEVLSPSGKYKLVISSFKTGKGTWNYTQGEVYDVDADRLIATVRRNYSSFLHLFIENHSNGHDYLVCGEDYQGQTVIELDTHNPLQSNIGSRKDVLSKDADKGFGFCWAEYRFDAASKILIVNGCYWACPYEFRFFDFSDPMNGWSELEIEDAWPDDDVKWPKIEGDTIQTFQTNWCNDDYEDGDAIVIKAIKTFKREGLKLVFVGEWVSDEEKKYRQEQEEASIKYEKKMADFKANDPLYLLHRELLKDPAFSPEDYESVGWTYKDWCPGFSGDEQRMCHRIMKAKNPYTIDLEWGMTSGPIMLVIYKNGNAHDKKVFPHSIKGMKEAFAYSKKLVSDSLWKRTWLAIKRMF